MKKLISYSLIGYAVMYLFLAVVSLNMNPLRWEVLHDPIGRGFTCVFILFITLVAYAKSLREKEIEKENAKKTKEYDFMYTEADVKHIATRFGRECVINQLHSCNDRIMHFEKWFDPANFVDQSKLQQ